MEFLTEQWRKNSRIRPLVRWKEEFDESKMTDINKDPAEWIAELETMMTRLRNIGQAMSNKDFMIQVLGNCYVDVDS